MGRVSLDTLLRRSEKNMGSGMNAIVKKSALELIRRAYKEGINTQITHGMRTYAQQNALYAQGRTKPGSIVTNARGGYSNHNFGLAVDYVIVSEDGKTAIWKVDSKWRRVAAIAKGLGFAWGGDWRNFVDNPHLEMVGGLSTAQLRAGRRPTLTDRTGTKTATAAPTKTSSSSSSSSAKSTSGIKSAQKWVNGYTSKGKFKKLTEDGINGPKTMDALLRIAQYFGKTGIDGAWGPKTKRSIPTQSVNNHQPGWTRLVQATLTCLGYDIGKSGIDGVYGSGTKAAVAAYQRSKGITADGIAGPDTFEKFFKSA